MRKYQVGSSIAPHERLECPCALIVRDVMEYSHPFSIKVSQKEFLNSAIHSYALGMSEFSITV